MLKKDTIFHCPVGEALEVFAGRWKPEILWQLQHGPKRFNQLLRDIGGVSQKMLTQQLRQLQRDGMVTRVQYEQIPPRVEYSNTELSRSLEPIFDQLVTWSQKQRNAIEKNRTLYDQVKKQELGKAEI